MSRYIRVDLVPEYTEVGKLTLAFIGTEDRPAENTVLWRGLHLVGDRMVEATRTYERRSTRHKMFLLTELTEKEYFLALLKLES